jgi:predicted dehydrogenase
MLKLPGLDAVSVCTPNHLHAPIAIDCLRAGKHVLVEKPMAANSADAAKMVATAKSAQRKLMVVANLRFYAENQYLKQAIERGDLGRIYYARAEYLRRRGVPSGARGWFGRKDLAGGGPLMDVGVHVLDLAWWLMGCPQPTRAFGAAWAEVHPRRLARQGHPCGEFTVEELATGLIRFENGDGLLVQAGWAAHVAEDAVSAQVFGCDGGATWRRGELALYHDEGESDATVDVPVPDGYQADMFAHFIDCIVEDKPPLITGEQGLQVVKMIEALYRSAETGRDAEVR